MAPFVSHGSSRTDTIIPDAAQPDWDTFPGQVAPRVVPTATLGRSLGPLTQESRTVARDSAMGPICYAEPVRPVAAGHGRRGCLRSASDILALSGMTACRLSLPTGRYGSICVDADNKPLLRAHDHDVLRDDHGPPHFHVRAAGHGAKVRIDTLEVLVSDLPRRELRLVLAWAEMHAAELDENWRRAREGATLQEIEPLR